MKKVVNIYLAEVTPYQRSINPYWTGLVLELEDGTKIQENSTDIIEPYSQLKPESL